MNKFSTFVLAAAVSILTVTWNAKAIGFVPDSFADLAEEKSKAVVNISTSSKPKKESKRERMQQNPFSGDPFFDRFFQDFFEGFEGRGLPRRPQQSLGSGVIISKDGYIVTNNHVIDVADEITVKLQDEKEYQAKVIGKDKKNDLALLKVDVKDDLPFAELADSDKVRVGDWAIAIGNPFGLGGTVTAGIISARGRNIHQGPYDDFLQTDAAINPGNSGGPLFNKSGEVIGINTAILSRTGGSQGIGFAVPSNTVELIVAQIKEHGRPVRGWLGVRIQTVTKELAEAFGFDEPTGALVAGVVEDSPAAKAGIEEGDLILTFDGKAVKSMEDLPKMVAETPVNKDVKVKVLRDERKINLTVKIAELEEDEKHANVNGKVDKEDEQEIAGMFLTKLTKAEREALDIAEDVEGVMVASVEPASRASKSGVRAGDVILQISKKEMKTVKDVEDAIEKGGKKSLLTLVLRNGNKHFLAFKKAEK